jgi:hypothetical protein
VPVILSWLAVSAGCGAKTPRETAPAPTVTRAPALCGDVKVRVLGRVSGPTELSGLVRWHDGTFWTHNDSGDGPRLFHLSKTGAVLGEVPIQGAAAVDWEDIAVRGRTLYIGDIGDNTASRPDIAVYTVRAGTAQATKVTLRYPDGAHDAETLLVDPKNGELAVITKDFGGAAGVYTARRSGTHQLKSTLNLGLGEALTGGDVSADGRTIVLRSYDRAFLWTRRAGESLAQALKREPTCAVHADLLQEGQGEALALNRDGTAFYTVPEGPNPRLRRYGG